jgi:hypothetical protein
MGLDMYLNKRVYVKNWNHTPDEKRFEITVKQGGKKLNLGNPFEIVIEGYYWRKANWIHQWFVENVQENNDNCGEYYVSASKLIELREILGEIIDEPSRGDELLPTSIGFFFGSTEYDEWYMQTIRDTYDWLVLEKIEDSMFDYYYSSSW